MSHVMNLRWSNDDTYLFSVGGLDCCTFQWKHVGLDEPTIDFVPVPNNFGRTMEEPAAFVEHVADPDDQTAVENGIMSEIADESGTNLEVVNSDEVGTEENE